MFRMISRLSVPRWFVLVVLLVMSCGKDKSYTLSGTVIEENGDPLSGVLVDLNGDTATSDSSGGFDIALDASPSSRFVLELSKSGYFDQTYAKTPTDGDGDNIKVVMLTRNLAGTVDAGSGGTVDYGGSTLTFPGGSFIGKDGGSVSGSVNIFAANISPDADNFSNTMPGGDFRADSDSDGDGILTSYGAIAVEAEDESGGDLDIRADADVCLPIPSSMRSAAPDTMEVWSMGAGGVWKSAGSATRVGDDYCFFMRGLGRVNCDFFSRMAILQGNTCSGSELPMGDVTVTINGQMSTQSNNAGFYEILVPANMDLSVSSSTGASASVEALDSDERRTVDLGCVTVSSMCETLISSLRDTWDYGEECINRCYDELVSCFESTDCEELLGGSISGPCWDGYTSCDDGCY